MKPSKFIEFAKIEFLAWNRSRFRIHNVAGLIIHTSFTLMYILVLLVLGHFFSGLKPDGVNNLLEEYLFIYVFLDFIVKLVFQKIKGINFKPYLRIGISKGEVSQFIMLYTIFHWTSLLFFLFLPDIVLEETNLQIIFVQLAFLIVVSVSISYIVVLIHLLDHIIFKSLFILRLFGILICLGLVFYSPIGNISKLFFSYVSLSLLPIAIIIILTIAVHFASCRIALVNRYKLFM